MKKLAIIAEYNPFHNGHLYQLNEAKKITDCDYAVAIMSGHFLQRGDAAFWDKYTRTHMALAAGIDLVLELPFCYATGSALDFAMGAVSILNALNDIDYLCFGAEDDDIEAFFKLAEIIVNEDDIYSNLLKTQLKAGNSYAKARSLALLEYTKNPVIEQILNKPNNILALEYICALKRTKSSIKPVIIKRIKADYHDKNLYNDISSATAIRHTLAEGYSLLDIKNDIPESTFNILSSTLYKTSPVYTEKLSTYLMTQLINHNKYYNYGKLQGVYDDICDINSDISAKLNKLDYPCCYAAIVEKLSGKQYTTTRIKRALLHLIADYSETDRKSFAGGGYAFYANILGFRKATSPHIKDIKTNSGIPLITKKADFINEISSDDYAIAKDLAAKLWCYDLTASRLYQQLIYDSYQNTFDCNNQMIIFTD